MRIALQAIPAACLLQILFACNDASRDSSGGTWIAEHDTIGDTVIVRTLSGSVGFAEYRLERELSIGVVEGLEEYTFGRVSVRYVSAQGDIYVYDSQVPALRKYDREGRFVTTFGREGEGPGEYRQVTGVTVASDGTVKMWDRRLGRLSSFSPSGEHLGNRRVVSDRFRPGFFVDTLDNIYVGMTFVETSGSSMRSTGSALLKLGPDGDVLDTLAEPDWGLEAPTLDLTIRNGNITMMTRRPIPFYPRSVWTFSPHGYYVAGTGDRYAVSLIGMQRRVLRIERDVAPVRVDPAEKSAWQESITASMRRSRSDWRWRGPPIPDTKPAFRQILVGLDGRIWVQLYQKAERQEVEELDDDPVDARVVWPEPVVFDVFEPDGRYVGAVRVPPNTTIQIMREEHIWGVTRDSLDIEYIQRFRLVGGV